MSKKLGMILAVLSLIVGVLAWRFPVVVGINDKDKLIGQWSDNYVYNTSNGKAEVISKTRYFFNGKYNTVGTMRFYGESGQGSYDLKFSMDASGNWVRNKNELIMILESLKTQPLRTIVNGVEDNIFFKAQLLGIKVPRPEDIMASGKAQRYTILKSNNDKYILQTDDPCGGLFEIIMVRISER